MCDQQKSVTKRIVLTVDEEVYDELRKLAAQSNRTLPKYVRHALKLHLYIADWISR